MSTNAKNVIRSGFLRNYTTKIKQRYILVEKGDTDFADVGSIISSANETLNGLIQELNIKISNRQLPYLTLTPYYGNVINKKVRAFLCSNGTTPFFKYDINEQIKNETEISHILEFLIAPSFKKVTINCLSSCSAKLVIDYKLLKSAIIDIMLDITMFNSYSFLKDLNIDDKKKINEQKFIFFKTKHLHCFYDYDKTNEELLYYSLSFSARYSEKEFDIDKYIEYWNEFVESFYPESVHKEKSIEDQMKQHIDIKEFPKGFHHKFKDFPIGAYLVLRTNKDRTEDIQPSLCSLFGINKYKKGKIKIVPMCDFEKYRCLMENLDVSAYKIVKQSVDIDEQPKEKRIEKDKNQCTMTEEHENVKVKSIILEDRHSTNKGDLNFKIGITFSGNYRDRYILPVCKALLNYGYKEEDIFYDNWHKHRFNGVQGDTNLIDIYLNKCECIVVLLSPDYQERNWPGQVEWRAIRSLINKKNDKKICLLRVDSVDIDKIDGLYSNQSIAEDIDNMSADEIAKFIDDFYFSHCCK